MGITVVNTPMSKVYTKGMLTVGATSSQFTATNANTVAMANCPTSLALGVRPNERSWMTFELSSMKPSTPVSTMATTNDQVSGVRYPTSKMAMTMATSMMMPPIVGVPCFTRWVCGPSARTCWPIWLDFRKRIHGGISTMVSTMPITMARNTRNVG